VRQAVSQVAVGGVERRAKVPEPSARNAHGEALLAQGPDRGAPRSFRGYRTWRDDTMT
jgi:hypothetical protein